jgi:hypothetical protein
MRTTSLPLLAIPLSGVILLLTLFFPLVSEASSHIASFVFATEQRIVLPGEVSEAITVRAVDAGGLPTVVGETFDVHFISSSATGQFSSSASNWVSAKVLTMNSNWANRTFYYKDDTEGEHTLSLKMVGRVSKQEWTASQNIIITLTPEKYQTETNEPDETAKIPETSTSGPSSHTGQTEITNEKEIVKISVGAGRERLSTVFSPVQFQAITSEIPAEQSSRVSFVWSFGDGHSASGREVEYAYSHTGLYAVVVNVFVGDKRISTARTTVKVVLADISITDLLEGKNGYLEVHNTSLYELNLGKWLLKDGKKTFTFPEDTILLAGSRIRFPSETTGLIFGDSSSPVIYYPNGARAVSFERSEPVVTLNEDRLIDEIGVALQAVHKELEVLQRRASGVEARLVSSNASYRETLPDINLPKEEEKKDTQTVILHPSTETANVSSAFDVAGGQSLLERIMQAPKRLLSVVAGIFIR